MQRLQCWNVPGVLRLIQSIPSPKAEPFKLWLAKVGYERLREIADPALGLERTRENWRKLGRSEKWITQRMTGQETRNKLTDYWAAQPQAFQSWITSLFIIPIFLRCASSSSSWM
jgi:hypothetical protein